MASKKAVIGSQYPQWPVGQVRVRLVQCRRGGTLVRPTSRDGYVGENGADGSDRLVAWFDFDDDELQGSNSPTGSLNCNVKFLNEDLTVAHSEYGVSGVVDFSG
jgi:hypothetical protein